MRHFILVAMMFIMGSIYSVETNYGDINITPALADQAFASVNTDQRLAALIESSTASLDQAWSVTKGPMNMTGIGIIPTGSVLSFTSVDLWQTPNLQDTFWTDENDVKSDPRKLETFQKYWARSTSFMFYSVKVPNAGFIYTDQITRFRYNKSVKNISVAGEVVHVIVPRQFPNVPVSTFLIGVGPRKIKISPVSYRYWDVSSQAWVTVTNG